MLLDVVQAVYKEKKLEDLTLVYHCYIEHSCRMHIFQFSHEDVDAFPVYNLHLISSSAVNARYVVQRGEQGHQRSGKLRTSMHYTPASNYTPELNLTIALHYTPKLHYSLATALSGIYLLLFAIEQVLM